MPIANTYSKCRKINLAITHERGHVTFVYSTLELRDEFIAVLFNGHDGAVAVPADSVRKISTRQS